MIKNRRTLKIISYIFSVILLSWVLPGQNMTAWSAEPIPMPVVSAIVTGSVIEDYDVDVPVIIEGEDFRSGFVRVFFNSTEARKVLVRKLDDSSSYLEVYLPSGTRRLEPGIYDITVRNDPYHVTTIPEAFSVIKSGDEPYNEESLIKDWTSMGTVISSTKTSEDTIELKSSLNDNSVVSLNLDELMGEDVLIRKISIDGRFGNTIGRLETSSKWADIVFYGLTLNTYSDKKQITLSLGRVEPFLSDALKNKLKDRVLLSDFIRANGENMRFTKIWLGIPFRNSDGSYIDVMRYDEASGQWYKAIFSVDHVDGIIEVVSDLPGIFVVVEQEAEQ